MPKNYDINGAIRRRDMLRRRYLPDSANSTPVPEEVSPLTRYVTDGIPKRPPLGATVADGLKFAEGASNRMVMSLYPAPSKPAIEELAEAWDLHPTIVEDLLLGQQRPKLDRYEDIIFIAIRSARYIDSREEVDFSEFHILMKPQAIAILCQDNQWIDGTSAASFSNPEEIDKRIKTLLADAELLSSGPRAVAYRLVDAIVDGFSPFLEASPSTRNRLSARCSPATPPSPNVFTTCPKKSSTCSTPPAQLPKWCNASTKTSSEVACPKNSAPTSTTSPTTSPATTPASPNTANPYPKF